MASRRNLLVAAFMLALGAASLPGLAQVPAVAPATPVPAGQIEINYHRCDGKYEKWGVHLWKSPNMPLPDIEWPNPMMPTGRTDFGVFWRVDEKEFSTGSKMQVNYIIHKGDIKEQGAKDMAFDGLQHKTIWVVNGDRAIYFSKEEALKDHTCKK